MLRDACFGPPIKREQYFDLDGRLVTREVSCEPDDPDRKRLW
jgi:hypothetical protein